MNHMNQRHCAIALSVFVVACSANARSLTHPGAGQVLANVYNASHAVEERANAAQNAVRAKAPRATVQQQRVRAQARTITAGETEKQNREVRSRWSTPPVARNEAIALGQENEVQTRSRQLQSEANLRLFQGRMDSETALDTGWYPQEAGWVDPSGRPVTQHYPWWMW